MRAESPKDQLQFFGDNVELPQPRFPIGTKVRLRSPRAEDLDYYGAVALRQLVRDLRKTIRGLRNDGYAGGPADLGAGLPEFNKDQIRERFRMMAAADSVEIAGHRPQGLHVTGMISNQCYLVNGQCHGGVRFETYLLFRRTDEKGRKLVYIHPYPIAAEDYLELCS